MNIGHKLANCKCKNKFRTNARIISKQIWNQFWRMSPGWRRLLPLILVAHCISLSSLILSSSLTLHSCLLFLSLPPSPHCCRRSSMQDIDARRLTTESCRRSSPWMMPFSDSTSWWAMPVLLFLISNFKLNFKLNLNWMNDEWFSLIFYWCLLIFALVCNRNFNWYFIDMSSGFPMDFRL